MRKLETILIGSSAKQKLAIGSIISGALSARGVEVAVFGCNHYPYEQHGKDAFPAALSKWNAVGMAVRGDLEDPLCRGNPVAVVIDVTREVDGIEIGKTEETKVFEALIAGQPVPTNVVTVAGRTDDVFGTNCTAIRDRIVVQSDPEMITAAQLALYCCPTVSGGFKLAEAVIEHPTAFRINESSISGLCDNSGKVIDPYRTRLALIGVSPRAGVQISEKIANREI